MRRIGGLQVRIVRIEIMSNGELYSFSQMNAWGNMVLGHKLQKTQSWNTDTGYREESPRVWPQDQCPGHSPGDCHAQEGNRRHWTSVGCPAPELIGTEISMNIASWKMGRTTESSLGNVHSFFPVARKNKGPKRTAKEDYRWFPKNCSRNRNYCSGNFFNKIDCMKVY